MGQEEPDTYTSTLGGVSLVITHTHTQCDHVDMLEVKCIVISARDQVLLFNQVENFALMVHCGYQPFCLH